MHPITFGARIQIRIYSFVIAEPMLGGKARQQGPQPLLGN
jgi:hypothetical protein